MKQISRWRNITVLFSQISLPFFFFFFNLSCNTVLRIILTFRYSDCSHAYHSHDQLVNCCSAIFDLTIKTPLNLFPHKLYRFYKEAFLMMVLYFSLITHNISLVGFCFGAQLLKYIIRENKEQINLNSCTVRS